MGRNSKFLFYIISLVIFLGVSIIIFFDVNENTESSNDVNEVSIIEDFKLRKNGDNGSIYTLDAKRAELFFDNKSFTFDNCTFRYTDINKVIDVSSSFCVYEVDSRVILEDSIKANYNKILLMGRDKSKLVYDIPGDFGEMSGGVIAKEGNNSIVADRMVFKKNEEFISFLGNVEVVYDR
ncbi:MAG: LPS export ABC transporter periplasmic protein LptC [Calditerrivibrio sp.]|nr:LPS export ABC transporter periplasmic protein LptC [Calditerrivibrio sp.]MCA1980543.1 LPS export ABC transporter periplasmic protein LptC [Calditerrivibrio sp.]